MRIDSLRAAALCFLAFFAADVSAHGLVQDPPARNWFCGVLTKPDQVQNGVAQYPVCGGAFFAPGIEPTAGYSFMSVLDAHHGSCGRRSAHQRLRFQFRDLEWRRHGVGSAHRLADHAHDRGPAQFHLEHLLGSALLGHLGLPLLDHEVRASCGRRDSALSFSDFEDTAVLRSRVQRRDAERESEPRSRQGQCRCSLTRCTVPARSGRHVIYAEWGRTPPTFERFHGCIDAAFSGTPPPTRHGQHRAEPERHHVHRARARSRSTAPTSVGSNLAYTWTRRPRRIPALYTITNPMSAHGDAEPRCAHGRARTSP